MRGTEIFLVSSHSLLFGDGNPCFFLGILEGLRTAQAVDYHWSGPVRPPSHWRVFIALLEHSLLQYLLGTQPLSEKFPSLSRTRWHWLVSAWISRLAGIRSLAVQLVHPSHWNYPQLLWFKSKMPPIGSCVLWLVSSWHCLGRLWNRSGTLREKPWGSTAKLYFLLRLFPDCVGIS